MRFIQLRATTEDEERNILWCGEFDDGAVISVYIGEPGGFEWVADFAHKNDALRYAQIRAEIDGATVDNRIGELS